MAINDPSGRWEILLKALLAASALAIPMVVALQVWQVTQIHELQTAQALSGARLDAFIGKGPRYTPSDARADLLELKQGIHDEVATRYPPEWLIRQISEMQLTLDELTREMREHEDAARAAGIE